MPKKKKLQPVSEPVDEPVFDSPGAVETTFEASSNNDSEPKKRTGVFLPLTENGAIDVKRLKGEDWKLDAARKALEVSSPGIAPKSGLNVSEDFVRGLYSAAELALQRAGVFFLKWPTDLAQLMKYSEEQKARLVPPTKTVIEKFSPKWLVEHQEIATLAVILATETTAMVQNALAGYIALHPELFTPVKPNGHDTTGTEPRTQAAAA